MLKDITIRAASNDASYARGQRYFSTGRVKEINRQVNGAYVAEVRGSRTYEVEVKLSKEGDEINHFSCSCPMGEKSLSACKHVVAVLKAIQEEQRLAARGDGDRPQVSKVKPPSVKVSPEESSRFLSCFDSNASGDEAQPPLKLEPQMFVFYSYGRMERWLEFRIGESRMYVVKNVKNLIREYYEGCNIYFGKQLTIHPAELKFADEISQRLWEMLLDAYTEEASLSGRGGYYYVDRLIFDAKRCRLTPRMMRNFFAIMGETPIHLTTGASQYEAEERVVRVKKGNPPLKVLVNDAGGAGVITLITDSMVALDTPNPHYILSGDCVYELEENFSRNIEPIFRSFSQKQEVALNAKDMATFFSKVLPTLEQVADVTIAPTFTERYLIHPLRSEVYIDRADDEQGQGIAVRLFFSYGDVRFNPLTTSNPSRKNHVVIRNETGERRIQNVFARYDFTADKGKYLLFDEDRCFDFFSQGVDELSEVADVFYEEAFKKRPVQPMNKVTAGVSVGEDNLLSVTLSNDDFDFDELLSIIDSYRLKKRYYRRKDGVFITFDNENLAALADFVESTGLKRSHDASMTVTMPLYNAMYLDTLAREEEGLRLERSKQFRAIVRDIRHPEDSDFEVPRSLQKVLRDYQATGFSWLSTLAAYHLGGILADDMGLGKTLQVIAFLMANRDDTKPPALVVSPTSLMYNWLEELKKFAPELKAAAIDGTKQEREAAFAAIDSSYDLIVTTYNMLKRDIDLYEKQTFRYCFLDEAQHIKNPATKNAKAVKKLKTGGYFALTGTPIENTLTELWSIFDFLMPGYLFSHPKFKQRFETPIVKEHDAHATRDLKRRVAPFILRRMKKDVLTELPDKVEGKLLSDMTAEQKKVYAAWFIQSQKEFNAELAAHGFKESRIKILAILTRLRQIACDPALFLEDYTGGSGKLDTLEEVVGEAVEAGHRILIFSQFTTMLAHIADRLKGLSISYAYLDGSTPAKERLRLVKEFNEGGEPVFLISLKAGGTGLNLTGADMVIHFDPWWNPAVEDQATDRAYRIGQRNNVQVLKFIAKDTIEEKIFALQEKKKSLIDQMIEPGENFLSKLTEEELRELFSTV